MELHRTNIEEKVESWLKESGIEYSFQYPTYTGFVIDFAIIEKKIAIEVDGTKWHSSKKALKKQRFRDYQLRREGWAVIHIPEVEIKGIRPLLMHSAETMTNGKELAKKDRGTRVEAESYLYKDGKDIICCPSIVLLSALKNSAVNFLVGGKGKKTYKNYIYSGVAIEQENIELISNGWETDKKTVVVGRARIIRARPRFDEWSLKFTIEILTDIITPAILKTMLQHTGKYSGIMDFRPLYGLFEVVSFKEIKE